MVGWELLLQAVDRRLGEAGGVGRCGCQACEVEGRGGPPQTEALALLFRFLYKERLSA